MDQKGAGVGIVPLELFEHVFVRAGPGRVRHNRLERHDQVAHAAVEVGLRDLPRNAGAVRADGQHAPQCQVAWRRHVLEGVARRRAAALVVEALQE